MVHCKISPVVLGEMLALQINFEDVTSLCLNVSTVVSAVQGMQALYKNGNIKNM